MKLLKREGVKSLYKGMGSSLVGVMISFGLYFLFYRVFKNMFLRRKGQLSNKDIMIITLLAGEINTVISHPIWMIQTRICIGKHGNFKDHVKEIYKEGGLKAFFKGILPNMLLVLNPIINFVIYEKLRKLYIDSVKSPGFSKIFLISIISKSIASFTTYPMLTLKTLAFISKNENHSVLDIARTEYKKYGAGFLYRGVYVKLFQSVLYNAFMMMSFEKIQWFIKSSLKPKAK